VAIGAGGQHACAILDTGDVRCWGWNNYGQLGYGNTDDIGDNETPGTAGPVDLGVGRTAVAITAGGTHTCALLDDATVRCWGTGSQGELGYGSMVSIGDNETPGSVGPVDLGPGRTAVAISAGAVHTCAILDTGALRCWGAGGNGQLGYGNVNNIGDGDGETPASIGPVDIGAGRTAVAISAGAYHTCVVLDTGSVRCWGYGSNGQLGYGNTDAIGDNETAGSVGVVNLGPGRKAAAISGDFTHTCALLDTGRVRCWGSGTDGALGYGNTNAVGDDEPPSAAGPVAAGGLVGAPTVGLTLAPKRDRSAPYRLRASGKLTGLIVRSATCTGKVVVTAKKGRRAVVVRPNATFASGACSYATSLRVAAGAWKVTARFAGNNSLLAAASTPRSFRAG
jgi:hypothetical protein